MNVLQYLSKQSGELSFTLMVGQRAKSTFHERPQRVNFLKIHLGKRDLMKDHKERDNLTESADRKMSLSFDRLKTVGSHISLSHIG